MDDDPTNKLNDVSVNIEPGSFDPSLYYTKAEIDIRTLVKNASNIPDTDDMYSLGSNGRRYNDIYAYTFHGLATRAIISNELLQHNANSGDILTWTTEGWRPRRPIEVNQIVRKLRDLEDVSAQNVVDESVLIYSPDTDSWNAETVSSFIEGLSVELDLSNYINKNKLEILPKYGENFTSVSDGKIDISRANIFEVNVSQPTTITFTSPRDNKVYPVTLIIKNPSDHVITWQTGLKWVGGEAPDMEGRDIVTAFTLDGIEWIATYCGPIYD